MIILVSEYKKLQINKTGKSKDLLVGKFWYNNLTKKVMNCKLVSL